MAHETRVRWWSLLIVEMSHATLFRDFGAGGPMDCQNEFAFVIPIPRIRVSVGT